MRVLVGRRRALWRRARWSYNEGLVRWLRSVSKFYFAGRAGQCPPRAAHGVPRLAVRPQRGRSGTAEY
jgi:hypothetical protein